MKRAMHRFLPSILGAGLLAAALQCMAATAPASPGPLIDKGDWKAATRALLLEARSVNRFAWDVPEALANAGFLQDALDTIAGLPPNTQPGALIALVNATPSLKPDVQARLAAQALAGTRSRAGSKQDDLMSAELAQIALFHARGSRAAQARTIFGEALQAATQGLREPDSAGYGRIAGVLAEAPAGTEAWMVDAVKLALQRTGDTERSAIAYRDLARAALRLRRPDLAVQLAELGIRSANAIERTTLRNDVLEGLAELALAAGATGRMPRTAAHTLAIQAARAGRPRDAHALLAGMPQNLYVDHAASAYDKVVDDAVDRQDLPTLRFFARHPVRSVPAAEARVWRKLAELEARQGARDDAARSLRKAAQALAKGAAAERYLDEVEESVALAGALQQAGLKDESASTLLAAVDMSTRISQRRPVDQALAQASLGEALGRQGRQSEARQRLRQAYGIAAGLADTRGYEKARLLARIAHATAALAGAKTAAPR